MARQIKSLAQKVAGAQIQAPSAPSAPAVRNWNGSMAAGATASAYGAKKGVTDTGMGGAPGGSAKPGIDKGGPDTTQYQKFQASKPKPVVPVIDPRQDQIYQQNVAALQQQWITERGTLKLQQNQADRDYATSRDQLTSDRAIARRDLAERLAGTGAMYSGSHRVSDNQADLALVEDQGDLLSAKSQADYGRLNERDAIDRELRPGMGSAWIDELNKAAQRMAENPQTQAAEGDPLLGNKKKKAARNEPKATNSTGGVAAPEDYKPIGARIRTRNKQIRVLRRKIENTANPHREKVLRNRLQKARKQRNKLVRKANNGKA